MMNTGFSKFLDLPFELRGRVYDFHLREIPRVANLGFRNRHSRTSPISAPSGSPIELLCVSQDVSREAARVIYCRTIFECGGAHEFSSFLNSLSERFRVEVEHVRFTQKTLPYQNITSYMQELQSMYTIERAVSAERPSQLPDILPELGPIDHTPSKPGFLEVCRQEEQFALCVSRLTPVHTIIMSTKSSLSGFCEH